MKKFTITGLLPVILLLGGVCYAQEEQHSGLLHTTAQGEESNLLKLHCDQLEDQTLESIIRDEFAKYPKEILSVDIKAVDRKIYVKYTNFIDPNMLMGILERVQMKAYYLDSNNTPVYYSKTGNESFKR